MLLAESSVIEATINTYNYLESIRKTCLGRKPATVFRLCCCYFYIKYATFVKNFQQFVTKIFERSLIKHYGNDDAAAITAVTSLPLPKSKSPTANDRNVRYEANEKI